MELIGMSRYLNLKGFIRNPTATLQSPGHEEIMH